jgi:hypothetical protein
VCFEWQVNNFEFDSWACKIRRGYIWHDVNVNTVSGICKKIKERCNYIERQNLFSKIKEKSSLIFYSEMKQEWARAVVPKRCVAKLKNIYLN